MLRASVGYRVALAAGVILEVGGPFGLLAVAAALVCFFLVVFAAVIRQRGLRRVYLAASERRGMDALCVYCGSSPGADPAYVEAARELGGALAERDIALVYGGGSVGMMGAVADAVVDGGGDAYGVIPEALDDKEHAHPGLTELDVVESMHARKARMAERADGFAALPGGFGTLEEIVEVVTWAQLGFHANPCGFLNVEGYFDDLLAFFDHQTDEGFVADDHRDMVLVADTVPELLDDFDAYRSPVTESYVDDIEQT